jgi:hypothetical protein
MKKIIRLLASGICATSLASLIFGGTPAKAATIEETADASFQTPAKRLVLDYSPVALLKSSLARTTQHRSHFSHSSHRSHHSGV